MTLGLDLLAIGLHFRSVSLSFMTFGLDLMALGGFGMVALEFSVVVLAAKGNVSQQYASH